MKLAWVCLAVGVLVLAFTPGWALSERGETEGHGVAPVLPGPAAIAGRIERVPGSPPRSESVLYQGKENP